MEFDLLPCAGCKELKVLKLGDYCAQCALDWPSGPYYIVVMPKTIDECIRASGLDGEYLYARSNKAFERFQQYIIYFVDGDWKEVVISDQFHIPTVMKNLMKKRGEWTPTTS